MRKCNLTSGEEMEEDLSGIKLKETNLVKRKRKSVMKIELPIKFIFK